MAIELALLLCVCSRAATEPPDVAVLVWDRARPYAAELVQALDAREVAPDAVRELPPNTLLVLPDSETLPAVAVQGVIGYLGRGGHLLALGGPPFQALLFESEGEWVPLETLLTRLPIGRRLTYWDFVEENGYQRGTNQPQAPFGLIETNGGIEMTTHMTGPSTWDTFGFAVQPPSEDDNVLRFEAAGIGQAQSLVVEVQEQDGSRWMATVPLTAEMAPHAVHEESFGYWQDSPSAGRGVLGDHLHLGRAARISLGFASSHQPVKEGDYGFRMEDLGTATLDPALPVDVTLPPLEGLCPTYKLFQASPARSEGVGIAEGIDFAVPDRVVSPIARPMHAHPSRETTWQPHVKSYDSDGVWCATPVSTTWRNDGASWTLIGFDPTPEALAPFVAALRETIATGPALAELPPIESPPMEGPLVTVEGARFMLEGQPWFAHGINFWPLYVSGMEPLGYYSHWLGPSYYIPELVEQDLALLERLGVNLVSIQYTKTEEAPQLRDFVARCHRHGIRANIWLAGAHPTEPADDDLSQRPYLELMRAADLAGVSSVFGYDLAWEPHLGPFESRRPLDALWRAWIAEQYGSVERAEAVWGVPAHRVDDAVTGPTDDQLRTDGPHRVLVAAYRRFVDDLVSRRYREIIRLADTIDDTHLYGVRTGWGGTGTPPLVGSFPYQLTSGAAHLDFVSPEGYGYGPQNTPAAGFITQYARWAGNGKPVFWAELGYPVAIGAPGTAVWDIVPDQLERQAEMYRAFAEIVGRSDADGWAGWWFPGGYRVDERSDFGIIAPDRTPRPAAQVLGEVAPALKTYPREVREGPVLTMHRDEATPGLAHLVVKYGEAFAEAWKAGQLPRIQTPGTGTTTADCPLTGVGGGPYESPQPAQYVNGEVRVLDRQGENVTLELTNTGEATWLASDTAVGVTDDGKVLTHPLPSDVPRSGRVTVTVRAIPGARVRMQTQRFGPFGEVTKAE